MVSAPLVPPSPFTQSPGPSVHIATCPNGSQKVKSALPVS